MGSIIFVHGTGVRKKDYDVSFAQAEKKLVDLTKATPALAHWKLVECCWGDKLGVELHLQGKSLPDYQGVATQQQPDEIMSWWLLYQDPELELRVWEASEKPPAPAAPGAIPKWKAYHQKLTAFAPSDEVTKLLSDAGFLDEWQAARAELLKPGGAYDRAIKTIAAEQDFQVFARLVTRACLASATTLAQAAGKAAPPVKLRDEIINGIVGELAVPIAGVRTWLAGKVNNLAVAWQNVAELSMANFGLALAYTGVVSRDKLSDRTFRFAGDILYYQARGKKIRAHIKEAIEAAEKPVVLLAHSLGGIACVELLIEENLLEVKALITAGSQAPMLYEMDCLATLHAGQPLPGYFPPWLNVHDLCDMLSYPASGVFPQKAVDKKLNSGLPYGQAHSAYWAEPEVWQAIADFILDPKV